MILRINFYKSLVLIPETKFEEEYLEEHYKKVEVSARYYDEDGKTPVLLIETKHSTSKTDVKEQTP